MCDTLAEISASEHPEERAAAGRALSAVLHGAASSTTALPGLGARAAASAGQASSAPPFPDAAGGGGAAAPDLIAARRFRPGGGIPQSSLFPMLQIVAMQDVASSAVELEATLHALLTAVDGSDQRQAVLECAVGMMACNSSIMPACMCYTMRSPAWRRICIVFDTVCTPCGRPAQCCITTPSFQGCGGQRVQGDEGESRQAVPCAAVVLLACSVLHTSVAVSPESGILCEHSCT